MYVQHYNTTEQTTVLIYVKLRKGKKKKKKQTMIRKMQAIHIPLKV